ncbi:MAG: hypothetical protein ABI824_10145 [Acidobacteriota bacterium]
MKTNYPPFQVLRNVVSLSLQLLLLAALLAAESSAQTVLISPGAVVTYNTAPIQGQFNNPLWMATDPAGNLYISDRQSPVGLEAQILERTPTGSLLLRSSLAVPIGLQIATDSFGNLYMTSLVGRCVKRNFIAYAGKCISSFEDPPYGSTGDGGQALQAQLARPEAIAADSKGNLFIWESFSGNLRKVAANGIITTVLSTNLNIETMKIGPDDQLYVSAYDNSTAFAIFRLTGSSLVHVVTLPDETFLDADFAIDSEGNFYVSDCSFTCTGPVITRLEAGSIFKTRVIGTFKSVITALTFDRNGNLYVAEAPVTRTGTDLGLPKTPRVLRISNVGKALPACTYVVPPTSLNATAAGGTLVLNVAVDASCSWVARIGPSGAGLLTLTALPLPFLSGSGTIFVDVKANTGIARDMQIFIGEQSFLIHQAATGTTPTPPGTDPQPGCTVTLGKSALNVASTGTTTGAVSVTATSNCTWAITASAGWITNQGAATGQGNGIVNFTVAANSTTLPRSGTLMIGGVTFTITQDAPSPTQPIIGQALDGAALTSDIAQGSVFVVKGTGLSPSGIIQANAPNYPATLNSVNIYLRSFGASAASDRSLPVVYTYNFEGANQLAAIMPSDVAPGKYEVRVKHATNTGVAFTVNVVARKPGIVTSTGDGSGIAQATLQGAAILQRNSAQGKIGDFDTRPAHPGDRMDLWGTGLGPDLASDTGGSSGDQTAAASIRVVLNGVDIVPLYAGRSQGYPGLDQTVFMIPLNVALRCDNTIQIRSGGVLSNMVTIATAAASSNTCPSN